MSEISYLVYSAASLVSKWRGLKTTKSTNSQNTDMEMKAGYGDSHTSTCDLTVAGGLERVHQAFVCYMNSDFSGISWAFPVRKVVRSPSVG